MIHAGGVYADSKMIGLTLVAAKMYAPLLSPVDDQYVYSFKAKSTLISLR